MSEWNKILELAKEVADYEGVKPDLIPDIDLYMDQVTTFIEKKMGGFKRNEEDKLLTKTMINNYTKSKLVSPPINKKYDQNHVMLLVIIYHLKQILSVNDMKQLLDPIIQKTTPNKDDTIEYSTTLPKDLYHIFTEIEQDQLLNFVDKIKEEIDKIELKTYHITGVDEDKIKTLLFVVSLIIQAERRKNLAEKIIDYYFTTESKD